MTDIDGKKVPVANLHITLSFLGNVDEAQINSYYQAADHVEGTRFQLVLDRLGSFMRSKILYMGCSHVPDELKQLVSNLEDKLVKCGYEPEKRPFTPHITLARKFRKVIRQQESFEITWPVNEFSLIESRSETGGVSYHVLRSWQLAN